MGRDKVWGGVMCQVRLGVVAVERVKKGGEG